MLLSSCFSLHSFFPYNNHSCYQMSSTFLNRIGQDLEWFISLMSYFGQIYQISAVSHAFSCLFPLYTLLPGCNHRPDKSRIRPDSFNLDRDWLIFEIVCAIQCDMQYLLKGTTEHSSNRRNKVDWPTIYPKVKHVRTNLVYFSSGVYAYIS